MHTLRRIYGLVTSDHVFGTTPGVRRSFLVCKERQHVVPIYRVVGHRTMTMKGCPTCGSGDFVIRRISNWKACWWVLSRYVWRQLVLRKGPDWDPRIACRD